MKGLVKLWLLLAVAFVIFFAYSWLGPTSLFGYELKTSKLSQSILAETEDSIVAMVDSVIVKPLFPQPVDTATKTILFIGDSMLDGLYPRLAAYAKASGHTLYTVIWYSSSTELWAKKERLTKYVTDLQPNYIFICLGSNELMIKDIKDKRTKYVKSILNEIDSIPFVWIGPPNWKEDTGINDMLEENLPEGTFFLSDGMEFKRRKDGAHPTSASAILWMDSVVRWMPEHCIHPIRLEMPEKKTDRAKRVFIHQPDDK